MAPAPIPPPDAFGMTSGTELPLYWCTYGTPGAARLVVLHGGPGAHHDYLLPQMLELGGVGSDGPGYELLFYDQRGGGRSKTGDNREEITWQTQTRDLAAVLSELAPDRPTIIGYSWGALLAMLYAAEAETHARRPAAGALVLIDPAAISRHYRGQFEREFSRRQSSPEVQRMRAALAESRLRERDLEAYRQRNFELSVAGYFADPRAARNLTPFRVTARVQQSIWQSLGDFDLVADGRLASIRVPTLIVHGRQDPIPLESSKAAAAAMEAQLVVLDDCGHVPYVEQPAALFAAIARFLDSRAGQAA
jgi:proline iminopeptidase